MPFIEYEHKRRPVYLQLGHYLEPDVAVLASDIWAYVDHHFAKSASMASCRHLWRQAHQFSHGLNSQPYASQPLHNYYAVLNATKAMVLSRPLGSPDFNTHGISFKPPTTQPQLVPPGLSWEVKVQGQGAFIELCKWMGDTCSLQTRFPLVDLLRQVVCGHRAFCTATGQQEEFVALNGQMRLYWDGVGVFEFRAELAKHVDETTVVVPPPLTLRSGTRTVCTPNESLNPAAPDFPPKLVDYHRRCRRMVSVIHGRERTTHYFRPVATAPDWSQISLNFAISMALSSLARYHPEALEALYQDPMGWVVKEYLRTALTQYIALVAAEITGRVIQQPHGSA